MTETTIGTAAMRLTMDTSDWDVAIKRAEAQQAGLGANAQAEASKMTKAQQAVVAALDRRISKLGLTREQQLLLDVAQRTSGATQDALRAKVDAFTQSLQREGSQLDATKTKLNQYGLSAKQEAAALRQVPAQLTDIFVSLQGGQNPLTVLLQQGGQLKDVFGGVRPAVEALGSALLRLVNPFTVVLALLAGVGASQLYAEKRTQAFNNALIFTGQQGRETAGDLNSIALSLDNIAGITAGKASDALAQVVATGKIAASQWALVTQAAVAMQDATGKALSETIAEYAEIGRDPVNAILKLNESEHFLTESIYSRIKALQDAGDIEGAAQLASEARANSQIERSQQAIEQLGLLQGGWHSVKTSVEDAGSSVVSFFVDLDARAKRAVNETLTSLGDKFRTFMFNALPQLGRGFAMTGGGGGTTSGAGASDPSTPTIDSIAIKEAEAINKGNLSRKARQDLEVEQIKNLYKQAGAQKILGMTEAEAIAASNRAYQESLPKGKSGAPLANAQASADLDAIKNAEQTKRDEIANTTKLLQAQYSARLVTTEDYYAQQRTLVQADAKAQEDSLTAQIAYLRGRGVAGKDAINVSKQIADAEQKLAKVRADSSTQLAILGIQEQDAIQKRKDALEDYRNALKQSSTAFDAQTQSMLLGITVGKKEAEITLAIADAKQKLARELERLALLKQRDPSNAALYDTEMADARAASEQEIAAIIDRYSELDAAQGNWVNGLKSGLQDWVDAAKNVAGQVHDITMHSVDTIADGMAQAALTGKLAWKDMLRDIGTEITKFLMKQAVLKFIEMFASAWLGGPSTTSSGGNPTVGPYALGGAFENGAGLSRYSGSVVNKPTPFYFARGAGVMGEAGPEGIFPLHRGSDGKLGIKAAGGGGDIVIDIDINVQNDGTATSNTQTKGEQAATYRDLGNRMRAVAQQEIVRAKQPGGILWKQGA